MLYARCCEAREADHEHLLRVTAPIASNSSWSSWGTTAHLLMWLPLSRRLKEESLAKLKPLQEAHNQLLAELAAQQEDSTQLLHARDQLEKVSAR